MLITIFDSIFLRKKSSYYSNSSRTISYSSFSGCCGTFRISVNSVGPTEKMWLKSDIDSCHLSRNGLTILTRSSHHISAHSSSFFPVLTGFFVLKIILSEDCPDFRVPKNNNQTKLGSRTISLDLFEELFTIEESVSVSISHHFIWRWFFRRGMIMMSANFMFDFLRAHSHKG